MLKKKLFSVEDIIEYGDSHNLEILYQKLKLSSKQIDKAIERGEKLWILYRFQKLSPKQLRKAIRKGVALWVLYQYKKLPFKLKKVIEKKKKINLSKILRGKNEEAQKQLDELFNSLGDNPKILWYPSAGKDYSILKLANVKIAKNIGINESPDLFIYTDYNKELRPKEGILFKDDETKVVVEAKEVYPLDINPSLVKYEIHLLYALPENAPEKPEVYLLHLEIKSHNSEKIEKPLLYFLFENMNFFWEVLFKHRINLTYLVKKRESSFKSIVNIYPFFSILNTKYLITDRDIKEVHFDPEDLKRALKWGLKDYEFKKLKDYKFENSKVSIFEIKIKEKQLTMKRIKEIYSFDNQKVSKHEQH